MLVLLLLILPLSRYLDFEGMPIIFLTTLRTNRPKNSQPYQLATFLDPRLVKLVLWRRIQ